MIEYGLKWVGGSITPLPTVTTWREANALADKICVSGKACAAVSRAVTEWGEV